MSTAKTGRNGLGAGNGGARVPALPDLARLEDTVLTDVHPASQLKDFVYERSRRLFAQGEAQRDALLTSKAVRQRQSALRNLMVASLGGLPPLATPLQSQHTGTVRGRNFFIEKVIFQSRPRHYVTANLYLPADRLTRTAAVLFLCGHFAEAKQSPEYQAVCQNLVRAGLIVLALDPIGQGERLGYFDRESGKAVVAPCTVEHDYAGAQCRILGDGLARYFLHDAMRGIDFLLARSDVDPTRIGVTGNSGGGTQTALMMMVDPRVAAAAPATFITSRDSYQRTGQAQDAEQIWSGFTQSGYDHEDILLAMAPKPVCVLAQTGDFFPIEGTRRTVERCRRIWALLGSADHLELVEDTSGHAFTPALARAAARFFSCHLLGRAVEPPDIAPEIFPARELQATRTGQVAGDFPEAEFVFDANSERLRQRESLRRTRSDDDRKTEATNWLRAQIFRDREACEPNPRRSAGRLKMEDLSAETVWWWSQPGLANMGILFHPEGADEGAPVTLAIWDGGTATLSAHRRWLVEECALGHIVFVLSLCGVGPLKPDPINPNPVSGRFGTLHKLADDMDWMGDSLAALRTYEVIKALDALTAGWPELAGHSVRVYGHGRLGVHGRLAAALDPRIVGWEWHSPFRFTDFAAARFYENTGIRSVILPGVLGHFDLDEPWADECRFCFSAGLSAGQGGAKFRTQNPRRQLPKDKQRRHSGRKRKDNI